MCSCPSEEAPQTAHFQKGQLPSKGRCNTSCHKTFLCH
uniref:Uncharacterized protein n=1 Tax=Rhizophora mucronata TaxID=61149 RepID=A0A2P2NBX1_RHIMU